MSPFFHLQPINLVVFKGSYYIKYGKTHLKGGFPLRCFQRLSFPYIATLHVLRIALFNFPTPTTDRDRTVSRRSEPSSRAVLMGEQPNPWKRLHLQDTTSRHRGAKHHRLCELLGGISLLSPG